MNWKIDPGVFCAGAAEGMELNRDDERVLKSDSDKPKNALDALASAPTPDANNDGTAGAEVMLFFTVVSSVLMEGELAIIADDPDGEENFGFLQVAVSSSGSCEWARAADFPTEKFPNGFIVRSDFCLGRKMCYGASLLCAPMSRVNAR